MFNKIYTYYTWYKITILSLSIGLIYFLANTTYETYIAEELGGYFWFFSVFLTALVILSGGYIAYMITYKLTILLDTLRQQSIFGSKTISRAIWLQETSRPIAMPIFIDGYATLMREKAIANRPKSDNLMHPPTPPVPSIETYRVQQRHSILITLSTLPVMAYMLVQTQVAPSPILHLSIYLLVSFAMVYIWYSNTRLDKVYFPQATRATNPQLLLMWGVWNVCHTSGFLTRVEVPSYLPFIIASLLLSAVIHLIIKRKKWFSEVFLRHRYFYYALFLYLPITWYNLLFSVNCLSPNPATTSVQTTVQAKQYLIGWMPSWAIMVNVWNPDSKETIEVVASVHKEIQPGDTVYIDVKKGLLGVSWYKASYLGRDTSQFRYSAALQQQSM